MTEDRTNKSSGPLRLLLLCNETMRKRCQCLSAALQCVGQGLSRQITVRMKCITYVEDNGGAFSLSAKTDGLLAESDVALCLLRVSRVHATAWQNLGDMLASRQARFCSEDSGRIFKKAASRSVNTSRLMLVQCCGPAYAVDDAPAATDTDPSSVDCRLRDWLSSFARCKPDDLANVSIDNTCAGKALRHRLFSRRYTVQVEFTAHNATSAVRRRHSLYRLTEGREAADGGCSPEAVVKRCQSLEDRLDCSGLDSSCSNNDDPNNNNEDDRHQREINQQLFYVDFVKLTASAVTLVVSSSRSCAKEAELCMNNLASYGHRAVSIDAFAASLISKGQQQQQQPELSGRRFFLPGKRNRDPVGLLKRVLTQLTPTTANSTIFLVFCRRYQSRLLMEFLRTAALPAPKLAAPPRACFVAIVGPVSEEECQKLRQLGSCDGQLRCQLDVICCPEGLAGCRVLTRLMPGLTAMMRQLEAAAATAGRDRKV